MGDLDEPFAGDGEIRPVGRSGQLSLGKRYAGKLFRVRRTGEGTIVLTPVAVIPESELWTTREPHASRIQRGLEWAERTPPGETDRKALFSAVRAKRARRK